MKMKTNPHPKSSRLAALLGMSSLLIGSVNVQADSVVKADTGTDLNDPASWAAAVAPTASDVAVWNGAALGAGLTLGADSSWLGISLSSAASDVDITGAGVLTLGASGLDASLATVNITLGVPVALGAAQTWNVALGFNATANGVVSGAFPLTKDGRGSLMLAGANTYSGGTILLGAAGTSLLLSNSAALGTGSLDLKSTSTSAGATVRLYGGINVTNPITMDSTTGREAIWSFSGNNTLSGPIAFTAGSKAFSFSSSGETGTTLAISNSINGPSYTGAFSLRGNTGNFGVIAGQITLNTACQIIGSANWMIASSGNSWTQTRLSATDGGFILGANDALAPGAKVLWDNNSSGAVDLAGFNQTVAGLDCASTTVTPPTVGNSSTTSDSLLKINGGGYTFVGTLVDAIGAGSRTLSLELLGGVQTLSGYNTYSGSTVVSGGTLRVNNALAGNGAVTVKSGATLAGSGTISGAVTVDSGGSLTPGDATGSGTLGLGSLTLGATGADTQTINASLPNTSINVLGALVANGTTTINVATTDSVSPGVYALITYSGPMITSGFTLGPLPTRMNATLQYASGSINLNVTSSSDSVKWTGAESGLWNSSAVNWQLVSSATPTTYVDGNPGDTVLFDDTLTGASNVILNATITPAAVTFNNPVTAYSLSGSGCISGTNALTKLGGGSLTLNTSNAFTGNLSLTGGSLIITNGSALGSGTKLLTVTSADGNYAELHLNGSSGPVILPSSFRFDTYGDALFAGNIVNDSGNNVVNSSLNMNSGGGSPKINVLGGSLTFNGDIWTTNGSSGKTMQLTGVGLNTINGVIRNGNRVTGLAVQGGTWILNNNNTYTGATTVTNGSLVVSGSTGAGAITVQNGGQLSGNGLLGGATTIQTGGTLSPGSSVGTLTLANKNLSLAGTAIMEIARNGTVLTNDQVAGISTCTNGGTLIVTNIGSSALQVGDSFQLFAATNYTGAFTEIVYPAGYTFTDNLSVNGTIQVLTVPTVSQPTLSYTNSGGNWVFTWAGSGFKLQTQTNSLSVGLGTNWVDVPGGNTSGVSVPGPNTSNPAVFFRLISTP